MLLPVPLLFPLGFFFIILLKTNEILLSCNTSGQLPPYLSSPLAQLHFLSVSSSEKRNEAHTKTHTRMFACMHARIYAVDMQTSVLVDRSMPT